MNLKELAENLGLSQTTVSRALNGYPEVSEATRVRVLQAAEQYNYRPNTRAKGLATGRSMAIGHVISTSTKTELVNPIFADFIAGAGETYAKNGYDMLLSIVSDDEEARVYRDLKAKGTIDGIIIHAPKVNDLRIPLLQQLDLPFLVHGRSSRGSSDYAWVDVNNEQAFQRATEFLLDLGHTRIALVNGDENIDFAKKRRDGFLSAMKTRGVDVRPDLMRSDDMTEVHGYVSAKDMLAFDVPPTAFLVASTITAYGVRRAIEESGKVMGREISVITYDDALSYFRNGNEVPVFTATRSSVQEAGRISAELLLEMIANPGLGPQQRLLEAQLVIGKSTAPAPKD
ncbi:LacI family DNA-binding transcriptional regulator [Parasulfitobacter algicola]|uniref:LacI family DNA-binding transcriptional regulator n=1 Tax=Parasulfitobacter algicola TaxID=2614809 RepID=A0ABX2IY38_9RHOB|nr:substrate-binding domain-containing protein [Sulfitobacter algicola]NSX55479.1 LacI family DNA-binding transcriptional regulator [Sulfitobacter algicola]